jgi:hypothetical protein
MLGTGVDAGAPDPAGPGEEEAEVLGDAVTFGVSSVVRGSDDGISEGREVGNSVAFSKSGVSVAFGNSVEKSEGTDEGGAVPVVFSAGASVALGVVGSPVAVGLCVTVGVSSVVVGVDGAAEAVGLCDAVGAGVDPTSSSAQQSRTSPSREGQQRPVRLRAAHPAFCEHNSARGSAQSNCKGHDSRTSNCSQPASTSAWHSAKLSSSMHGSVISGQRLRTVGASVPVGAGVSLGVAEGVGDDTFVVGVGAPGEGKGMTFWALQRPVRAVRQNKILMV